MALGCAHEDDPFVGLEQDFPPDLGPFSGNAFEDLLGRLATEKEKVRLLRLQKVLDIPDSDTLWMILVALQYHLSLYEEIPNKIAKAAKVGASSAIAQIHIEAQQQLEQMRQRGEIEQIRISRNCSLSFDALKKQALDLIAQIVKTEAKNVSKRSLWAYFWISVANVALFLLGLAMGFMIYASNI